MVYLFLEFCENEKVKQLGPDWCGAFSWKALLL